jgi:hypothetical protein
MKKLLFVSICLLPFLSSQAKIITVDDNGPADFDNIQEAIRSSGHGDTIIVKPGTYKQGIFFNNKAVMLTSENPDDPNTVQSTIITTDSGYGVSFDFEEGNGSVLRGFTITGGGIHCYGSSPTISKNIIRDCDSDGIRGEQDNVEPLILDNTISSNNGYGIYNCHGPIENNIISNNKGGIADCGGDITSNIISKNVFVSSSTGGGGLSSCGGKIAGNIIAENYASHRGGACYGCTGDITGNRIIGNTSLIAGGALSNCSGVIRNNIIAGNRSTNGGGLFSCYQIYNNTIVGNIASEKGGALSQCPGDIINNIIAFNSASSIGGISGAAASSYNTFWSNEGGNYGGGATNGPGDIIAEPLFVSNGYWDNNETPDESDDFWVDGDYHVTSQAGRWSPNDQRWVQDRLTSPCVDGGDPNNPDWTEEFWPHGKRINIGAYGGTNEASMSRSDVGNVADLNPGANDISDWVDYRDMVLLTNVWLSNVNERPLAEDLNRDGIVDFTDFAILTNNWNPRPLPPIPNPMTWAKEPKAVSTSEIEMLATNAASGDNSGVEYYFDCNTPGGHSSGWQDEPNYMDTGLETDTEYSYRVKARNKINLIETAFSDWYSTRTSPDLQPPDPDPATWATEPYAVSPVSIRMEATIASDQSGVEYYFDCTSNLAYSSQWQDSPVYEVSTTSLQELPKDLYSFVVRVRDKSPNRNTTGDSKEVTVDLKPPAPDPAAWQTEPYRISSSSIRMVAQTASDYSGVEYYFACTSNPAYSSGWQDSPDYRIASLPKGYHSFVVRVRDKSPSRNITGDSTEVTVDLQPPAPDPMKWAAGGEPHEIYGGNGSFDYWVEMTATEATDASGSVEYYFECTTESGFSSRQTEPTYKVKVGRSGQGQRFRVKAIDMYGNETAFSPLLPAI